MLETIRAAERAKLPMTGGGIAIRLTTPWTVIMVLKMQFCWKPATPEILLEEKQLREQLYAAVMALPEKQAERIYARYYLGMRVSEIAAAEGVDPSRVRDSIRRGLKQLEKYF